MSRIFRLAVLGCWLLMLCGASTVHAEWDEDGNVVTFDMGTKDEIVVASDFNGHFYIAWTDKSTSDYDIYAQKFDAMGIPLWQQGGILVCGDPSLQMLPSIEADGYGGAIIVWQDYRNNNWDIFAQRIESNGNPAWSSGGYIVCDAIKNQRNPKICNSTNYIYIAWRDQRDCSDVGDLQAELYAQRISMSGNRYWPPIPDSDYNGICVDPHLFGIGKDFSMAIDDDDCLMLAFTNIDQSEYMSVYAQRLDANGVPQWPDHENDWGPCVWCYVHDGIDKKYNPTIITKVINNIIRAFIACDYRVNNTPGILCAELKIDRESAYHAKVWSNDVELPASPGGCKNSHTLQNLDMIIDENYQLIISWDDECDGDKNIYSQRITSGSGEECWPGCFAICDNDIQGLRYNLNMANGGFDRSIFVWDDTRDGYSDVYYQVLKHSTSGMPDRLLGESGAILCDAPQDQSLPQIDVDYAGAAFTAWSDRRSYNYDIYASRIDAPLRDCMILEPNGGEVWGIGKEKIIVVQTEGFGSYTNNIPEITDYELFVSYNGGVDYESQTIESIAFDGETNISELTWIVTGGPSDNCTVKVITHYNDGITGTGTSSMPFTIDECDPLEIDVSSSRYHESNPYAIPDGSGNYFITWENSNNIYLNIITPDGIKLFADDILVNTYIGNPTEADYHSIAPDDQGGLFVVWKSVNHLGSDMLYLKRLGSDGFEIWSTSINPGPDLTMNEAAIISDGTGGAFVACHRGYQGQSYLYATRIDNSGTQQWQSFSVFEVECEYPEIDMLSDGQGGVFIAFQVGSNSPDYFNIYVCRIDAENTVSGPVQVTESSYRQKHPQLLEDGDGGAFIVWQDYRDRQITDIYAQRINAGLNPMWANDGIPVCTAENTQYWPRLTPDNTGGFVVVWHDKRNGIDFDIYAQRITSDGTIVWLENGTLICNADNHQLYPNITSSPYSDYIICWIDNRDGSDNPSYPIENCALFTQQLNKDGKTSQLNGVKLGGYLAYRGSDNYKVFSCTSGGVCGAIAIWEDDRENDDSDWDVYAKLIGEQQGCLATEWGLEGVEIVSLIDNQEHAKVIPDGQGNTIIAWEDRRNGSDYDLYIQKVDASGAELWGANGTPVCQINGDQIEVQACPDGAGGAIIVWRDHRYGSASDIWTQRIDSSGNNVWTANGIAICTESYTQMSPIIVPDRSGGAIITWIDNRNLLITDGDIYGQRVDASGQVLWAGNGVPISTLEYDQDELYMINDDSGGAFVAYHCIESERIRALQINGNGEVLWEHLLCIAQNYKRHPKLLRDGTGGVIIVWQDYRNEWITDIYAQRVDASGSIVWATDGVGICVSDAYNYWPTIAGAGDGKAIIAWHDNRNDDYDIYAQCIDLITGALQWSGNGVPVGTVPGDQWYCRAESIDDGGIVIGWNDGRNGDSDIYAQKVTVDGACVWQDNGLPISAIAGTDEQELEMCNDGVGGFVFVWSDWRGTYPPDVYAQRLLENPGVGTDRQLYEDERSKILAAPRCRNSLCNNYPNPFNPSTTINFSIARSSHVNLSIYNVKGQLVRTLVNEHKAADEYRVTWNGKDNRGIPVSSGVYFYAIRTDSFNESKKLILLR